MDETLLMYPVTELTAGHSAEYEFKVMSFGNLIQVDPSSPEYPTVTRSLTYVDGYTLLSVDSFT